MELKNLKDISKKLINVYQIKAANSSYEAIFTRDDIKLTCTDHPNENLERILVTPVAKKRLYCIDCIIEEKDNLKAVKSQLLPIYEYLTQIAYNLEENEAVNEKRIETMHDGIKDFLDEHQSIEDAYTNIIECEKGEIDKSFDDTSHKINECIKAGTDELKSLFDSQNEIFKHNSELMLSIVRNTYHLDQYPNRSAIYSEITTCKDSAELEDCISRYLKILHPNDIQETLAVFDIIHTNFSNTLDNPIKFECDDFLKTKQTDILEYIRTTIAEVVKHYKELYYSKQLKKLRAEDFRNFHKDLNSDCLNGFVSFENHRSYKLKHHMDIISPNNREYTCIANIHNKYLAYGCNDGSIELFRANDGKYIKTLQRHQDYVSFITYFEYYDIKGESDIFLVSTGANDRSIYFWNIVSGEILFTLDIHEAIITSIVDTGDGKHLTSGSSDGTIVTWNVELQAPVQILRDSDYLSKPTNYFNCLTLKILNSRNHLIKADLKGNVTIYTINDADDSNFLHQKNIISLYKPITHVFASKIKQNYFVIKTTDSKIHLIDGETCALKKTHEVSRSGDVVLLENRNSIFDQEFILINTNSIEDCISNSYLDDVPAVYVRDFLFSGLCSRNRVQLIQDVADSFKIAIITKTLGSSIYSII